jgi:nucleoid-associated protein YgaU
MRYVATVLFLVTLVAVGCKQPNKSPVMTTSEQQPPATLEPIPPAPAETPAENAPPASPAFATPPPQQMESPAPPPPSYTSNTYTVQKGDTLWSIAQRHLGNGKRWREIVELNPGLEPSKLRVGQVIILPAK